jgi:hypothetical protein
MNEISPLTMKSGESLKYSDSDVTKGDAQINMSGRSSLEMEGGQTEPRINLPNLANTLNSDLQDEHGFWSDQEFEETKIANMDGTFRFVLTEVITGKAKIDMYQQSQESEHGNSKTSEDDPFYQLQAEGSIENSIENASFIRNLMQRRNLSPEDRGNQEIHVGALSEVTSNIDITNPEPENDNNSQSHIKVENNKESEDEDEGEDLTAHVRYPMLDDITEKPDNETDRTSSLIQHDFDESRTSNNCSNNNSSPQKEPEFQHYDPIQHDVPLKHGQNNFLKPTHLSPKTASRWSMSSSSMGMISPPASTFGIKSELDSDPKQPYVQKNKIMEFKTNYDIPEFSLLGKFEKLNQNSEPKMYISPLSDKTNLQHWNWANWTTDEQIMLMRQKILATDTIKKSPEKNIIELPSQEESDNEPNPSDYFAKNDMGTKSKQTKHEAMIEYGFENKITDNGNSVVNNDSKDFFTK